LSKREVDDVIDTRLKSVLVDAFLPRLKEDLIEVLKPIYPSQKAALGKQTMRKQTQAT
jgi:hypothetical protein